MRLLLNLIWLVLAGFWMFLAYLLVGVLWCITIIGIPFGIASFRIGLFALWPFGRTIIDKPGAGVGSGIGNVLWFISSGIWLAIGHALTGVALCLTVIGIPLGLANFKLIPVSLFPLGKDIVPASSVTAAFVPPKDTRSRRPDPGTGAAASPARMPSISNNHLLPRRTRAPEWPGDAPEPPCPCPAASRAGPSS